MFFSVVLDEFSYGGRVGVVIAVLMLTLEVLKDATTVVTWDETFAVELETEAFTDCSGVIVEYVCVLELTVVAADSTVDSAVY